MIASVHGVIDRIGEGSVVVRVGGVGMLVAVPNSVLGAYSVGDAADLLTHLIVREDSLTLYGFIREEERRVFTLLLGVTGVGPRLALSVVSTLQPEMLASAVQRDEPDIIARVPGIGKKTAAKIVLELKGKLMPDGLPAGLAAITSVDADVIEALTTMGFSIVEAQAALQSIPKDAPKDIEDRVRLALAYFAD